MKTMFTGYYAPSEEEFNSLWSECLFVFDANTLLNLYRYSKESRDLLFKVMEAIKERLWLPHQIALEYHRNMLGEIYNQESAYKKISDKVQSAVNSLENYLKDLRHSNINVDKIIQLLKEVNGKIQIELEEQKESHPDLDMIKEKISNLFEDKVGEAYDQSKLDEIYKIGAERYENKIPPGFEDSKDKENKITHHNNNKYLDQYGDLIYWKQILDKSSKDDSVKSIILITDDNKKDWVLEVKGQKKGPHPELIHEFKKECGNKLFYLYNTEQFLGYAKKYLKMDGAELDFDTVEKAIENVKSTKEFLHELENDNLDNGILHKKYTNFVNELLNTPEKQYEYKLFLECSREVLNEEIVAILKRDIYFFCGVQVSINDTQSFGLLSGKKAIIVKFSTDELLPTSLESSLNSNNINILHSKTEKTKYTVSELKLQSVVVGDHNVQLG